MSRKHNARGPRLARRRTPPHSRRHAEDTIRGGLATSASVLHITDPNNELPLGSRTILPCFQDLHQTAEPRPVSRQQLVALHTRIASATMAANQSCCLHHLTMMNHAEVTTAQLSHPPQSAASLVVPRCRCRKRRHQTLCHAELTAAKQRQPPPWSTASSQVNRHAAIPGRHHNKQDTTA